jgi:hypothetical protein
MILFAVACRREAPRPPAEDPPPPAGAGIGQVAQTTAPAPSAFRDAQPSRPRPAAFVRCEAGLAQVEHAAKSLDDALATFRRECADVHQRGACRAAWTAAANTPRAEQTRVVARACAPSYCPLGELRDLRLCRRPWPAKDELDRAWAELQHAIWQHELGNDANALEQKLVRAFNEAGERWPTPAPRASVAPVQKKP